MCNGGEVMAHAENYKLSGAVGVLRHNERKINDNVQSRKNECIDSSRTGLNYNLAPERCSKVLKDHIRKVCQDNGVRLNNRKDLNIMSSWVITAPKPLLEQYPDRQKEFFERCYEFLCERYGKEFVLSSMVHLDETTPHMHFEFIPVGYDRKNDRLTVSSKFTVTRTDLRTFHQDLERYIKASMNINLPILNKATAEGNKSIDELKRQSATERLQEATEKASKIVSEAQNRVNDIRAELVDLEPLRAEYKAKKAYIAKCAEKSKASVFYPEEAKVTKRGFIHKKKFVTVPLEMWESRYIAVHEKEILKSATNAFEESVEAFCNDNSHQNIKSLNEEISNLRNDKSMLINENIRLKKELQKSMEKHKKVKSAIMRMPLEIIERFSRELKKEGLNLTQAPKVDKGIVKKN